MFGGHRGEPVLRDDETHVRGRHPVPSEHRCGQQVQDVLRRVDADRPALQLAEGPDRRVRHRVDTDIARDRRSLFDALPALKGGDSACTASYGTSEASCFTGNCQG